MKPTRIAVLGGDSREIVVAGRLATVGHEVVVYGNRQVKVADVSYADSPEAAVAGSAWLVCPSPGLGVTGEIYAPSAPEPIRLDGELLAHSDAARGGLILGQANEVVASAAAGLSIDLHEMKLDPALSIVVGCAAAEAIVRILVGATERLLREIGVLVLGYGATGSAICDILTNVGCRVTSASRDAAHRAISRRRGATPVPFTDWPDSLDGIDVLVNTVPQRQVLTDQVMSSLTGITVIDISSPPSALDHAALHAAGINVIWARGLAGERAPVTVGDAQFEYVCSAMKSKEDARYLVKAKGSRPNARIRTETT